jgi:hypothetical protein
MKTLIATEAVEDKTYLIRGQKVMLSTDLAELYGIEPKVLVQAVKRNLDRFADDFMFQLKTSRGYKLEVTNCDFKLGRCETGNALCVYGARGRMFATNLI